MENRHLAHAARAAVRHARLGAAFALAALVAAAPRGSAAAEPIALPGPASFAAAVAAVEAATGARAEPLDVGKEIPGLEGRAFGLDGSTATRLLEGSHDAFKRAGLYLFRYERGFGLPGEKDRVGLLATADRSVVVRRIGTSGPKEHLTPDALVAWLDLISAEAPFELTEIGVDYLAGRFAAVPADPHEMARRFAAIAPELVAGRDATLALLGNEIRVNRTLYLIW